MLSRPSLRRPAWWLRAAPAFAVLLASPVSAQMPGMLDADPDMPMKEGFDTDRAIFWAEPNFVPLRNPEWQPLGGAMRAGDVSEDTPVLTMEVAGRTLVFIASQMSYHHVAQGEMAGEPWMITF